MADLMNKRYLDYAGLNLFWEKVKEYFAAEGSSVELAERAKKLVNARLISLAGDAQGSVSFDGSQNVVLQSEVPELLQRIEAIKVLSGGTANPGADETASVVTIVPGSGEGTRGTIATINLSAYAKKADFATVLDFKGVVADIAALNAITGQKKGDIYLVKDAGNDGDGNPQTNVEFIWTTVDNVNKWEMLGPTVDMSGYATDADLSAEIARAEAAEAALSSDLADEVARATAAESSLTSAVDAEVARAEAAEAALTSDLADEASRAAAAEAAISSDLADETSRAEAAEANLASDIADETSRAEAAEADLYDAFKESIPDADIIAMFA